MSALKQKSTERIRRWLPHLLPGLTIGLAWWEMISTQLAPMAGSGG